MSDQPLTPVSIAGSGRAYEALTAALADEPFYRWLFAEDSVYAEAAPKFLAAISGSIFSDRTAWQLNDFSAVALLRSPGLDFDPEGIGGVIRSAIDPARYAEVFDLLEQMDLTHPVVPHWTVVCFGVVPTSRGTGLDDELLSGCLAYVDITGLPVMTLASEAAVSLYERHGFNAIGQSKVESSPTVTALFRDGRDA